MIREILVEYTANPRAFDAMPDVVGTLNAPLTVYVPDDVWLPARDVAYSSGRRPVSAYIRKGFLTRLSTEEDIPA